MEKTTLYETRDFKRSTEFPEKNKGFRQQPRLFFLHGKLAIKIVVRRFFPKKSKFGFFTRSFLCAIFSEKGVARICGKSKKSESQPWPGKTKVYFF